MRTLSLAVVGAEHPNKDGGNRRSEIMFCDPGEPVELRPEVKNPVDPQAVAVFSARGFQIGYIRAERAAIVRKWIAERPYEAVFQEMAPWGAIIRIAFDGADLTLPVPRNPGVTEEIEADQESEWQPDYEPPDEFL